MKIEFSFRDQRFRLKLGHINLFYGGSRSGKTELSKILNDGFSGNDSDFFVDLCQPLKKEYEVICCESSTTIQDEIKMTSKTLFSKLIKDALAELDNSALENERLKYKNAFFELSSVLNAKWKELSLFRQDGFIGEFSFNDLHKFIKTNYSFYSENNLSRSTSRLFYYQLCQSYLSKHEKAVFIIDDFENALDLMEMMKIIDEIKNDGIIYFLFTNSAELCSIYYSLYPVFLMQKRLANYNDLFHKRIEELIIMKNKQFGLNYLDDEEVETGVLSMMKYHQFIITLWGHEDALINLDFLEKNKIIDENGYDFLKNFVF